MCFAGFTGQLFLVCPLFGTLGWPKNGLVKQFFWGCFFFICRVIVCAVVVSVAIAWCRIRMFMKKKVQVISDQEHAHSCALYACVAQVCMLWCAAGVVMAVCWSIRQCISLSLLFNTGWLYFWLVRTRYLLLKESSIEQSHWLNCKNLSWGFTAQIRFRQSPLTCLRFVLFFFLLIPRPDATAVVVVLHSRRCLQQPLARVF